MLEKTTISSRFLAFKYLPEGISSCVFVKPLTVVIAFHLSGAAQSSGISSL
jgi:hypothetical protein